MARNSPNSRKPNRKSTSGSFGGVMDMARERPIAAAATAAGAVAASVFLWSKRVQISDQLSQLSDQIGEWTDAMVADRSSAQREAGSNASTTSTRGPAHRSRSPAPASGRRPNTGNANAGNGSDVHGSGGDSPVA